MFVDARRVLLEGLIDYAGLFPPASLTMDDAVAEYRSIRESPDSWIAARFIVPASRLVELASVLTPTMQRGEPTWPIAVILDGDLGSAVASTQVMSAEMGSAVQFVFAELPLPVDIDGPDSVSELHGFVDAVCAISPTIVPFFEIPRTPDWRTRLGVVLPMIAAASADRHRLLGVKLRTGGATSEAFPSSAEVADFVIGCAASGVPLKATAGLHHPYHHTWHEIGVQRHGFINLLVAVALADVGASRDTIIAALGVTADSGFTVGMTGISVGDVLLDVPSLQRIRTTRFPSYGSCSFDEPTDELRVLGLLPKGPT